MNEIVFEYYDIDDFREFLHSLDRKDAVKMLDTIENIKKYGLIIAVKQKWVKKLEKNLYEIRNKRGSNIQRAIYFKYINGHYVITHGFVKKQQKTPKKEIERGERLRDDYFRRLKNGKRPNR